VGRFFFQFFPIFASQKSRAKSPPKNALFSGRKNLAAREEYPTARQRQKNKKKPSFLIFLISSTGGFFCFSKIGPREFPTQLAITANHGGPA
jgi:hypothetical protein